MSDAASLPPPSTASSTRSSGTPLTRAYSGAAGRSCTAGSSPRSRASSAACRGTARAAGASLRRRRPAREGDRLLAQGRRAGGAPRGQPRGGRALPPRRHVARARSPRPPERGRTELAVLSQLGPALMSVHGWPAPEVGEAFERAERVARGLERSSDLAPPLVGSWLFHVARGQFARAEEISGELFRIAGELDDAEVLLQAHHAAWPTRWLRGRFADAEEHIGGGHVALRRGAPCSAPLPLPRA